MKRIKGCINPDCVAKKKKRPFKEKDRFCSQCGHELVFVCKKCFMQIPDEKGKGLCIRCIAQKEANREKRNEDTRKVLAGGGGAIILVTVLKDVIKELPNAAKRIPDIIKGTLFK